MRAYEKIPIKAIAARPIYSGMAGQKLKLYAGKETQKLYGAKMTKKAESPMVKNMRSIETKATVNRGLSAEVTAKVSQAYLTPQVSKLQVLK